MTELTKTWPLEQFLELLQQSPMNRDEIQEFYSEFFTEDQIDEQLRIAKIMNFIQYEEQDKKYHYSYRYKLTGLDPVGIISFCLIKFDRFVTDIRMIRILLETIVNEQKRWYT